MINEHVIRTTLANREIDPRLRAELQQVFKNVGQPISKNRSTRFDVSQKTQRERLNNVSLAFEELAGNGFHVQCPRNFGTKHVQALVDIWRKKNLDAKSIDNKLSYLRFFSKQIGKPNLILRLEDYVPDDYVINRSRITVIDKTVTGHGHDVVEILKRVAAIDVLAGLVLTLQLHFGLRVQEAAKLRIADALDEAQSCGMITIKEGTKGGRPRVIPVKDEASLDLLRKALPYTNTRFASLIPEKMNYNAFKTRFYRACEKAGFCKSGEYESTSHALRHQYYNDMYYKVAGALSPVQGGTGTPVELHNRAMDRITHHAGHSQRVKSGAYVGTPRMMERHLKKTTQDDRADK